MIAPVYVNHGRWVVECPNPACSWAYLATDQLDRCVGDGAGTGCRTTIEQEWPAERAEIVAALLKREATVNRNWAPGETVDQLLVENDAHLVGRDLRWLAEQGIGVAT